MVFNLIRKNVSLFFFLFVCGCSHVSQKGVDAPKISTPESFSLTGEEPLEIDWWYAFDDAQLNEFIALGLDKNYSLIAVLKRLERQRVDVTQAVDNLGPQVSFSANKSVNWNRDENNDLNRSEGALLYGVNASWEIDLWGKYRKQLSQENWERQAGIANYKIRANAVAGNIASAWFNWVTEIEKQRLLFNQYRRTKEVLSILQSRFLVGSMSIANIWRQKNELDSIINEQIRSVSASERFARELAVWQGEANLPIPKSLLNSNLDLHESLPYTKSRLPSLPDLPKLGVPLRVLSERPDIQQAFAQLKGNDSALAAAIRDRFPSLNFSASARSEDIEELFSLWSARLVASFVRTVALSGIKNDAVRRQKANAEASAAEYQQVWLDAIQEVEGILSSEREIRSSRKTISKQLKRAREIEKIRKTAYMLGNASYLELLNAQESTLNLERRQLELKRNHILTRIKLYRAISHGNFSSDKNLAQEKRLMDKKNDA